MCFPIVPSRGFGCCLFRDGESLTLTFRWIRGESSVRCYFATVERVKSLWSAARHTEGGSYV